MIRAVVSLLLLCSLICSCGFRVVYGDKQNADISYLEELAAIRIKKDRNRLAQDLKTNLYDLLNSDKIDVPAKYFLILTIKKSVGSTFTTITGSSGRNRVTLNVDYELKNIETGELISSGTTFANDSYDVTLNRYGSITAEEYIEYNLTKAEARNLRNLLVNDVIDAKNKAEENKQSKADKS